MNLPAGGEAAEADSIVYAWVLRKRQVDLTLMRQELDLPMVELEKSLERLCGVGLVVRPDGDHASGFAVDPAVAIAKLTEPIASRMREEERRILEIQEELSRFAPLYAESSGSTQGLEVLGSLTEVRAALNREADLARDEMITCQPGGGSRKPEAMSEAMHRDAALLDRGVSIRTLYHHTARFNGPSQAYVAAASALGAQYRTLHELFGRIIVFDRRIAFLPVQDQSWGAVVLKEPSTVAYLCDVFEEAWERGTPFVDAASQGLEQVSREIQETIVRLMAEGHKDEVIARRLGMSLRTARRHIADIMEQLKATSRFQAGVAAATRGFARRTTADRDGRVRGDADETRPPRSLDGYPARDRVSDGI
ncbi:helix-turn-helix transcriptional regulator [Streptomyces sp. MI02-7b]|uniref:helix-turn-helix transcriptional regulator n=1 Tax=Streptomyces sp. MI02-7b TaxID=462941 RepID=UPI0029BE407E|nr:helix-turn-helix transcriptional regulator [Streptomyces sp. MI02-7b]MDX3076291.1 helix-turn-helix transcriptional regulator [Streptomyces sp. MI02-7b]